MQMSVEPGGNSRGDCVRLIKRLIVYPTTRAFVLSDGITALTVQLIPGRRILDHSTTRIAARAGATPRAYFSAE